MKVIKLNCLLMDNNEIMFNGRSLGFLKPEEIEEYTKDDSDIKLKHLNLKLKAEEAQSSWLDTLTNQMRDYANRSDISDSEREDEEQAEKEVNELHDEYEAHRKELRAFEKEHNL